MLMPNYTDAFVKAYLGYESIEAFETALYDMLYENAKENYTHYLVGQTWDTVVENTEVIAYPEDELESYRLQRINEAKATAEAANVSYETYISIAFGMTVEEFEEYAVNLIKDSMKTDMICYAIARAENLSVSDEKYHEYIHLCMSTYEIETEEEVEEMFGKEALTEAALREVVKEFIAEHASVTVS